MAGKVDATEKLSFEGSPSLMIKSKAVEVNVDVPAVLKIINLIPSDDPDAQDIMNAYGMIFSGRSKTELEKLKLSLKDLIIVVQEAMQLISGVGEPVGEEQWPIL